MNKSVMDHQFSRVPSVEIPRSSFDRSHGLKTTFDGSYLYPIYVDEALPGDTFSMKMTAFGRMATPIHPIMDNLFLETFFFAVPVRLIWDNWNRFNGEQINPGASIDFTVPQANEVVAEGSLSDYMGLPVAAGTVTYASLHHRAYNLIWNEWFRDQNLQTPRPTPTGDGPDVSTDFTLQRRGKRHDYFTSALPWPQKGDAVSLPLGTSAPVAYEASVNTGDPVWVRELGSSSTYRTVRSTAPPAATDFSGTGSPFPSTGTLVADLTGATAATINELRQAFQIQRMQERDARGGTRYIEIIRSHFGVVSPDARLQRPEFLGGGTSMININPVEQTSETVTGGNTPQGNLAAFGTVTAKDHGFTRSFTEHCVLIGLVNVRADLTYQQGMERMFFRETRYDYYWPSLAQIGEQAILSKEIYHDGTANDEDVFGYQERYAEYRYKPSRITGQFRSAAASSLDPWHLSQNFSTRPVLGASFISENVPISRVVAVTTEPEFLLDAYFQLRCARPMPLYGVPGMIDHF